MQRSGPQFALNKERTQYLLPPRRKSPNPLLPTLGIKEQMKASDSSAVRQILQTEAEGFEFISERTKRAIARLR